MSLAAKNWNELERRGAEIDNAEYVFLRCTNCNCIAMYDEERMQLFQDPKNLHLSTLYGTTEDETVECSCCRQSTEFTDTQEDDRRLIEASEWSIFMDA